MVNAIHISMILIALRFHHGRRLEGLAKANNMDVFEFLDIETGMKDAEAVVLKGIAASYGLRLSELMTMAEKAAESKEVTSSEIVKAFYLLKSAT